MSVRNSTDVRPLHHFHTYAAANRVLTEARKLTNAQLWVDRVPVIDSRQDPPGEYAICSDCGFMHEKTVFYCIEMATQRALAAELRKVDPDNPLLTIWHLRQDKSVYFYNVYDI